MTVPRKIQMTNLIRTVHGFTHIPSQLALTSATLAVMQRGAKT